MLWLYLAVNNSDCVILANLVGAKQLTYRIQLFCICVVLLSKMRLKMQKHWLQTIVSAQIGSLICFFETSIYRNKLSLKRFYTSFGL